ncbi:MAG: hypothetical protein EXX96DRAFT_543435 [Benjaminiella poitrasii]|nr:MAG: hypothetical protein EXX96DRAFT_543435 [Benjaminiella poitrasii]
MQYSLNVFGQTKILPIVIVINIDGFSSKHFREENFTKRDNEPIAFQIFTCESNSKVIRDIEIESFCDAVASQFKKVIHNNTLNDEISRKRIEKYAEDGVSFAENFKRRCIGEGESVCVTPIQTTESKDLIFVKELMKQNQGKMKWSSCYDKGIEKGLFGRFASYSTLKMAFHRHTL